MVEEKKNCLLCGATSEKKTTLLWECLRCGLLFKNPDDFWGLQREKARYLTHNNDEFDAGYLAYLNKLWSKVSAFEGEVLKEASKDILDFGCGPSEGLKALVKSLNQKNIKVESYDPIFFPESYVNKKTNKKFDLVYASECLEHFYEPKESFEKLLSFVKPRGGIAISTGLSDGEDLNSWWYLKDPTHVVFYSKKTFEWLSEKYNLKIIFLENPNIILLRD